eukprot:tig00020538_g10321.t1
MAVAALRNVCGLIEAAIQEQDGDELSDLLTLHHPAKKESLGHLRLLQAGDIDRTCKQRLGPPYDDVVANHIRFVQAMAAGDFRQAYDHQASTVAAFHEALKQETMWLLPVLHQLNFDLRLVAEKADQELVASGSKPTKLNDTPRLLQKGFSICATDRNSLDQSKKWGALTVINALFKIYFKLNTLRLCKNVIRAVDSPGFPDLERFPVAQKVTYKFFVGRLAMFEDNYRKAEEDLLYAFTHCHKEKTRNKRLILQYLVPVRLLSGHLPSHRLLEKYSLLQYEDLCQAVRTGNLKLFSDTMTANHELYVRQGVYLILEKCKIICFRNLFKRVYTCLANTRITISKLQECLRWLEEDLESDEVECILSGLIFQGMIKGYLSHQRGVLVLSKQQPFPPIRAVLAAPAS